MMHAPKALSPALAILSLVLLLTGCIRPKYYHVAGPPAFAVEPPRHLVFEVRDKRYGTGYFRASQAYEAYVEFNQRGALYRDAKGSPAELQQALELIRRCRFRSDADSRVCPEPGQPLSSKAKPISLYIFVHGWKNNASEDTSNPWGYRRLLSYAAWLHPTQPVVGIYIGWPGASLKGDVFLSFWNREPVADVVGNASDLTMALKRLLHEAKGELNAGNLAGTDSMDGPWAFRSADPSTAVVIGHSFGGIVLEHAATTLLQDAFNAIPKSALNAPVIQVYPPADLIVLINEAGAASIAMPFLERLKAAGVTYTCTINKIQDQPCPLILSMTSEGDLATKFAYPGGEFLSFNRPATQKFSQVDQWGQGSSLPYDLVTTGNFIALQNHSIDKVVQVDSSCYIAVTTSPKDTYCMHALPNSQHQPLAHYSNTTPYWVMQLPQIFVPDHGTVFQPSFLELLNKAATGENHQLRLGQAGLHTMQIE